MDITPDQAIVGTLLAVLFVGALVAAPIAIYALLTFRRR